MKYSSTDQAHEAFEMLTNDKRGLRDLTNVPSRAVNSNEKITRGKQEYAETNYCYCKLLLTKEDVNEIFTFDINQDRSDLETVTGVSLNSNIDDDTVEAHVVVMAGNVATIHDGISFIAERIGMTRDSEFISVLRRKIITLRVIVPNSVVGVLMGRGGKDIRNLAINSGVRIQISQRVVGCLERVVHVTGTYQQAVVAATTITETIQSDPHTEEHSKNIFFDGPVCIQIDDRSVKGSFSSESFKSTSSSNLESWSIDESQSNSQSSVEEFNLEKCLLDLISQLEEHPDLLSSFN
jgi:hypothetical protein